MIDNGKSLAHGEDEQGDPALRPQSLTEFTGQTALKRTLGVAIGAARARGQAIDHVLLSGPPGLGKTTLAKIIANEMGYDFRATSAPALARAGDLVALLVNLGVCQVLFIDEVHRLAPAAAEALYTAMEDHRIDIVVGEGSQAKTIRLDIPPFTLVGATTRPGMLPGPFRDRFGLWLKLDYYSPTELFRVLERDAALLGLAVDQAALEQLALCARGTPRIAKKLLRRARDHAEFEGDGTVNAQAVFQALEALGIDGRGLDRQDRAYLETIARHYRGGPVGVDTLSAALSEDRDTLEDAVEPFLMQLGMIQRTPRGRMLTATGYAAIGWATQPESAGQASLLDLARGAA